MTEEWRPVALGRLRRISRYDVSDQGRVRNRDTGRILRPYRCPKHSGVYLKVDLRSNGLRYQISLHLVVARAWLPNPEHKPQVNHIDTDPLNCAVDNLEWATQVEQEAHKRFWEFTV